MLHPAVRAAGGELPNALTPVYPTVAGLPQAYLRKAVLGGLARADALFDQCAHLACFIGTDHTFGHAVKVVQRQAQAPHHQPGGFVKGSLGAVAKTVARLQAGGI